MPPAAGGPSIGVDDSAELAAKFLCGTAFAPYHRLSGVHTPIGGGRHPLLHGTAGLFRCQPGACPEVVPADRELPVMQGRASEIMLHKMPGSRNRVRSLSLYSRQD